MKLPSHKSIIRSIIHHPELDKAIKMRSLDHMFTGDHIAHFDQFIPHIEFTTSSSHTISFAYKLADELYFIMKCDDQYFIDIPDLVEYINSQLNITEYPTTDILTDTSTIRNLVQEASGIESLKMYNRRTDNGRRLEFPEITEELSQFHNIFSNFKNITVSYKNYLTISYTY
jgi:hypothetical protein